MRIRFAVVGTDLKIFNANSSTLLETLKLGIDGFSGIMANFHPRLYSYLIKHYVTDLEKVSDLQQFLGFSSVLEKQLYPVNAKYYLQLEGVNINTTSRTQDDSRFSDADKLVIEQFRNLSNQVLASCYAASSVIAV